MSDKFDKQHKVEELKEMLKNREPGESVEEVLVIYCSRHGISLDKCLDYYDKLVKAGEIKEK